MNASFTSSTAGLRPWTRAVALAGLVFVPCLFRAADARAQQPAAPAATTAPAGGAPAAAAAAPPPGAPVAPETPLAATAPPTPSAPSSPTPAAAPPPAAPPPPPPPPAAPPCKPCEDQDRDVDAEGYGAFLLGLGALDLSELNDHLSANGYESFENPVTLLGGEGHAVLDSGFVIGGRGAAILMPEGEGPGDVHTQLSGAFGTFDLGFALVHTPSILFTLVGGIGGYGLSLGIDDQTPARFDDVLDEPARSTELSAGGLLVALTLGLDGRVPVGKPDRGRRGFFTLGARLGALYGPPLGGWSLRNADVRGGPSSKLLGGYAALAIGFGGGRAE